MKNRKYYSLENILDYDCTYNIIFGERSNGKTYACLKYALERYLKTGEQLALVRRWREDFTGKRGASMFSALIENGELSKLDTEWEDIYYYSGRWWLARWEDDKRILSEEPFAYGFSLGSMEHDKSTSYPNITTIIFDEFITRGYYLPDEFVVFLNVVSTIVRDRTNVKIFMLGNTVNQYCPYFAEMGLNHIKTMKPGSIDIYGYGEDDKLRVAVEYTKSKKNGKPSDFYFAFDNPKLSMITGGAWEIDIYPHLPYKYKPKDILFTYFIQFAGDTLQCEIIQKESEIFTFIHKKTGEIKHPESDLVFTPEFSSRPNYIRKITKPRDNLTKKIAEFYIKDKIFYANNETGEIVRNYLMWCNKN